MHDPRTIRPRAQGFTLPAVMVVAAALLILAIGLLSIIGIERKTSRSFADMKRAELAARAGLEDFRAVLRAETSNDDYLVIGGASKNRPEEEKEIPQHLFIARGEGGGDSLHYRYVPLYSTKQLPGRENILEAPEVPEGKDGEKAKPGFAVIPGPAWLEKPTAEWIPVENEKGEAVARYAYWVEDLQGRVNAKTAGNTDGLAGANLRNEWPSPAAGINPEKPTEERPKLNQVAIHVLDPKATEDGNGSLTRTLLSGRPLMLSPGSIVAAGGFGAPLKRNKKGLYEDELAAALEKSACPIAQPYQERAMVPYAAGISDAIAGLPKKNLNELLNRPSRDSAVDEFAAWVDRGLPRFADERRGGFPDDYLKTIAANAFDYADTDSEPTLREGSYRGLDSYPLSSEVILHLRFLGKTTKDGRLILNWRIKLFCELWNMTNMEVDNKARYSYEVALAPGGIGAGTGGIRFDDASLLDDPSVTTHNLSKIGGDYWTQEIPVKLRPNEYKMYEFASVTYAIDVAGASDSIGKTFTLSEPQGATGLSLMWDSKTVERIAKIVRDSEGLEFNFNTPKSAGKAAIPGHSYGPYGDFHNNMGDPRMSHYIRNEALGGNAYPQNISPNRRNIRREIYDGDKDGGKTLHYGRVLPGEWPDGGHNSAVGTWPVLSDDNIEPTDARYGNAPTPVATEAPHRISNEGVFFSATELGRIYDPMMWHPTYPDASDTATMNALKSPRIPVGRLWPEVELNSPANADSGGGNTLRIGRPEHPRFRDRPGLAAANLLDLFHTGDATSGGKELTEGELTTINGHVNLNTADRDTLRALAAGLLKQDPLLGQTTSNSHQTSSLMAKPVAKLKLGAPTRSLVADRIADAIIHSRPFASAAEIADAREEDNKPIFGNRETYSQNARLEWTDAAAEEVFARVYDASTTRSRNFRIWVIGQAIAPPREGSSDEPEVLAESKKCFTVFADPGERTPEDTINPSSYRPRVTHENDF